MEEVMIQAAHVSMRFYRELNEANSVKERMVRMWKGERQVVEVKALNDVSFTIGKGEIVGIIGVNGSGKSTLLKLIAGVLPPTQGHLLVDHDKVQLLTLGTGFDHELTGRSAAIPARSSMRTSMRSCLLPNCRRRRMPRCARIPPAWCPVWHLRSPRQAVRQRS